MTEFEMGYEAYQRGFDRSACPVDFEYWQVVAWKRGWNTACYEVGDLYD